jgi:hypothetical protein
MSDSVPCLRTNEHEEAVRSLEFAESQARSIASDGYHWKWVLISLHNAAQGFMVLALWNGNGLLAMPPKLAEQWLAAHEAGTPYPKDKLDRFLNLYAKVKDDANFHYRGSVAFRPGSSHDASFKYLNDFRNEFIHFTPKGWSLLLPGLPAVALDVLSLIEHLGWRSSSILWHERSLQVRAKCALRRLRRTLNALHERYDG